MPNEENVDVVVRFRDGSTSRRAGAPEIDIEHGIVAFPTETGEVEEIPFGDLKAVFFRRAASAEGDSLEEKTSIISVEFADGEVIRGKTRAYNPIAPGFFLDPIDSSRNDRIFVVSAAVIAIEVERF